MASKRFACLFFALCLSGLGLRAQSIDSPEDGSFPDPKALVRDGEGQKPKNDYLKEGYYDRVPRLREIPEVDASAFPEMRDRYRSAEFDYEEDVVRTNVLQRILGRIRSWLEQLMPDVKHFTFGDWFYKLLATVGILAALLILYRALFSGNRLLARSENERDEDNEIRFVEKNLLDTDLAAYIARAEKGGDYALAVRYLNLRNIQLLARREIVRWRPAKTNAELIEEIRNPEIKREFGHCARIFDRVWFGNAVPDRARYEEYASRFLQFQSKWT